MVSILEKLFGRKELLEEKAREIKAAGLRPARSLDITKTLEKIEKEYTFDNLEVQSGRLGAKYDLLRVAIRNFDFEIYCDRKGMLYVSMTNFALKYSGWKQPFVALT